MPSKKVVYIVSLVDKSYAFEWIAQYLKKEVELEFILLNPENSTLEKFLLANNVPVKRIRYRGTKDIITAFFQLLLFFLKNKTDVVHTHLFEADFIGILASWIMRVKKRIYTRHNSSLYFNYYPKLHLIMKLVNKLSTNIVSISKVTTGFMNNIEHVPMKKIIEINHGFDIEFIESEAEMHFNEIKQKYNIPEDAFVVGAISRFVDWKGIEYIVRAFCELRKKDPTIFLILANANGAYKEQILKELEPLPKESYLIIPFEHNVYSLYKLFDVFIHVPINDTIEAFGQTYIESMILKIPMICTLSGIANEIVVDKTNALVVDYKNSTDIKEKIELLKNNSILKDELTIAAFKTVNTTFSISKMNSSLLSLYQ